MTCGAPLGAANWPAPPGLAALPNVLPLPGLAMRDARFWAASAKGVAANLDAFATDKPLSGVVRNASVGARRQLKKRFGSFGRDRQSVPSVPSLAPSPSPPAVESLGDSGFTMSEINP